MKAWLKGGLIGGIISLIFSIIIIIMDLSGAVINSELLLEIIFSVISFLFWGFIIGSFIGLWIQMAKYNWNQLSSLLKIIFIISVIILILISVLITLASFFADGLAFGFILIIYGVLGVVIISLWTIGFLLKYLIKKKKKLIANIISGIGLLGAILWLVIFSYDFFRSKGTPFGFDIAIIFIFILLIVIYFIIALVKINAKPKQPFQQIQ